MSSDEYGIGRRSVLAGIGAGLSTALLSPLQAKARARRGSANVSVVLAHGAWADGSSWAKVIGPLAADGIEVLAAPLPLTTFADDVAALNRTIERAKGPVILAAHAYAGAVIAAAQGDKVKSLVYVSALAPDEGEKVTDVFYHLPPDPRAPKLAPDSHGLIYLPHEAFANAFAPNGTAHDRAILEAVQRPLAPACISVPVPRPLWKDKPSWFLIAQQDRMILEATQQFMASRMKAQVRVHPVDHIPLVTAPPVVLSILHEAIAAA
jgi:pimeloyl-ACP methyl ester carboxylesterase